MPSFSQLVRPLRTPWVLGAVGMVVIGLLIVRALTPPTVSVVSLEQRDVVRTLVLVGRVRAPSRARLGATLAARVVDVRAREGTRVEAGEVLVLLDDREARARVAEAEAAMAEISASVQSQVEQAEQEATLAQRDLERIRAVAREGGLTRQRVEQAEQRAADAMSRLEAARAGQDGAGPAAVERARSTLEAERARLEQTRVRAPADGVVLLRDVEPGDVVQPGRTLLEMAIDGPTEIVVFPAEENLPGIRMDAAASASADAYPDQTFDARVSLIAPSVDPAQGTVEVRLVVPAPPDYLLPDMTLSVNIEAGRRDAARVLPADAVRGLGTAEPWVGLVVDGRVERRGVDVGLRAEEWVEIRSGIALEDRVVPPEGSPPVGARVRVRDSAES